MGEQQKAENEQVPRILRDLRRIYNGLPARTTAQQKLKTIFDQKPQEFFKQLQQAEKDFDRSSGRGGGDGGAVDAPPPTEDFRHMPLEQLNAHAGDLMARATWTAEKEREECRKLVLRMADEPRDPNTPFQRSARDALLEAAAAIGERKWGPNP